MFWHFWKCKQMLWLWIATGWGLKSIHPLKSHCTKAFKSYSIRQDESAELFFFFCVCSVSSDLFDLCTRVSPRPPAFLLLYTFIYLSFHILSQNDAPREKKARSTESKSQRTATTCFSGPQRMKLELVELWSPQILWYTLYDTEEKWHTHVHSVRNTKAHVDTWTVRQNNGTCSFLHVEM